MREGIVPYTTLLIPSISQSQLLQLPLPAPSSFDGVMTGPDWLTSPLLIKLYDPAAAKYPE